MGRRRGEGVMIVLLALVLGLGAVVAWTYLRAERPMPATPDVRIDLPQPRLPEGPRLPDAPPLPPVEPPTLPSPGPTPGA